MSRIYMNFIFVLLLPFFRVERALSDVTRGRRLKVIKLYNLVMDSRHNPLSKIPDTNTRHLVMQVLAWMWCITFSLYFGSFVIFGYTAVAHFLIILAVVVTVGTFKTAESFKTHDGTLKYEDAQAPSKYEDIW